ncbi:NUDIX hydrolase [Tabrizicola sp.]|uniref:NUDIX hydrolase n=1 Tax=Tabrizicola sp. TaxID=2005166 RepID=UPI0027350BF4|nr:NUDIX hydrolase [Tabrizicola sp.]MDP3193880.1 NUDIX hydrolase [Tabrizicola sp.]
MTEFTGAKAALFCGASVLVYLRDKKPGLRWPGLWDLPGGGREGAEGPEDCLLRELWEEFGLRLSEDRLVWRRVFPSMFETGRTSVFFGGRLSRDEVASVCFGDEGQGWELMPVKGFLAHPLGVPEMQRRAGIVWEELQGVHGGQSSIPE